MPRLHRLPVRTAWLALAVVPLLLLLDACSNDDAGTTPTNRDSTPPGDRPSLCTTEPTHTGVFTDPGQVLCFGTAAVLPTEASVTSSGTGTMSLMVTGIDRADDALIDDKITEGMSNWTSNSRNLWFVRAEVELVSESFPGALDGVNPLGILNSIRSTEGVAGESYLDFESTVGDCTSRRFDEEGPARFTTCDWQVMQPEVTPYSASWADTGDYGTGKGGIVWAPQ